MMMAKKGRYPGFHPSGFAPTYESEGSGSLGRVDTEITVSEDSSAPKRKCINLNVATHDGFGIPMQILPLSKMSPSERKDLILKLRAELEQIRVLQKRVEGQRSNGVTLSSSSDILSSSNTQAGPSVEYLKKSSGFISGSWKKVNPPDPTRHGWNRGTSGRFESASHASARSALIVNLMKQCEALLKKLMQHQYGWVFNTPVDVVKLNIPDYFTVIKHPMDLGTIKKKIASSEYASPLDFLDDVRLTFSNAMTYNPCGNDVHFMADTVSKFFEVRWKAIEKKLPKDSHLYPSPEKSGLHEEKETLKPLPQSKKRKITSMHHKVMPDPVKRIMTDEEKYKLSKDLEAFPGELPDNIIEFLKEQISNGKETGEDEVEIDIDDFSNDTLFTLRKLLDDYSEEKETNRAKVEPCEIEVLNDSGPSNSSMPLCKGNDAIDDDVDIGGNEPPVSSYPLLEIEKGMGHRRSACISSGSSSSNSDSDSSSSDSESGGVNASTPTKLPKENSGLGACLDEKTESVSGLDQLVQTSQKLNSIESDCLHDGESAPNERQVSPDKLYRAALLRNRFADTILKAREKTFNQVEKGDPEKLRREREELEMQKKKEKARLQAEAKAAEDARRRADADAEAEAKRKRELDREAARQALQKMEKTVEINENSRFLEDLDMLRIVPPEQLPSSVDEMIPDPSPYGLGSFKFVGSNPLEQLGLYMKMDEEEDEGEPPCVPNIVGDVEEGEID
ncbi:Transcription factor like [Actinidia chinensis var. chinensis]|uniref:Transcription factor like n=1 Tax=Actinidia chinensis var. chinensis TaxID=1590841 RepID=A0A2R6RTZ1_ACTCC|nr:Transcription factor like [Actinidia chinensis var. chinensis]